jgi:predicted short-subunit dehydrogenase-like oxidoreductase (DUF2520 family)
MLAQRKTRIAGGRRAAARGVAKRLEVAIVGAGRVGRALGQRLHEKGWRVGAVVARSLPSARAAVRAIGTGRPHAGISRDVLAARVVLIATPDDAIRNVATELAALGDWRGKIVLHASGALDRTALAPLAARGAATGSLHPLQTFSGRGVPALEGSTCAIEGDAQALRWARRIALELGCVPVVIPRGGKAAYHAAAAFAAGHVLSVMEAATQILMAGGFSRQKAQRALLPLTRQTLANFETLGPAPAWTGPARRGDFETVARHVAALRRFPPEVRAAYEALSRLSVRLLDARPHPKLRRLDTIFVRQPKAPGRKDPI